MFGFFNAVHDLLHDLVGWFGVVPVRHDEHEQQADKYHPPHLERQRERREAKHNYTVLNEWPRAEFHRSYLLCQCFLRVYSEFLSSNGSSTHFVLHHITICHYSPARFALYFAIMSCAFFRARSGFGAQTYASSPAAYSSFSKHSSYISISS